MKGDKLHSRGILHRYFPSRLEWQKKSEKPGNDEQRSGDVNWDRRLQTGIQRNDGRQYSENAVRSGDDGVTGATVLGREQLGSDSIQHTVHDVGCETVATVPAQQNVGRMCSCASKQEDAGES